MESFNKKFMAKIDSLKQRINKKKKEDHDDFDNNVDMTDHESYSFSTQQMNNQDYYDQQINSGPNQAQQGIMFKNQGNECLKNNQPRQAIDFYNKAINFMPNNPIVYCNRSTAYKKLNQFSQMYDDSIQAIELDDSYFKAYIKNGEACVELGKNPRHDNCDLIEKGIKRLKKGLMLVEHMNQSDKSYSQQSQMKDQIQKQIKRALKIKWFKEQELAADLQQTALLSLQDMVKTEQNITTFEQIRKCMKPPIVTKNLEIPDYLICRITDDLMEEPVVLASGFTYEKASIQKHFQINGNFDPMTREEVKVKELISNKHIKHATEAFLRENPWSFEHFPGETIMSVHM